MSNRNESHTRLKKPDTQDNMEKEIIVTNATNRKYGFMSNSSRYEFELGGKRWPTVEHYVLAKKFEGTRFEDVIRKSPTVYQARILARGKVSISNGERVDRSYGNEGEYRIKSDWKYNRTKLMKRAIDAKFSQNPRLMERLIKTWGYNILVNGEPETGNLLVEVRDSHSKLASQKNGKLKSVKRQKDFPKDVMTIVDKKIIKAVIDLGVEISKYTGWDGRINDIVLTDALDNLIESKTIVKNITHMADDLEILFGEAKLPKQKLIVEEIQKILSRVDPLQNHYVGDSYLLSSMLKYYKFELNPSQKSKFMNRLKNIKKIDIVLDRSYRFRRNVDFEPPTIKRTEVKYGPEKRIDDDTHIDIENIQVLELEPNVIEVPEPKIVPQLENLEPSVVEVPEPKIVPQLENLEPSVVEVPEPKIVPQLENLEPSVVEVPQIEPNLGVTILKHNNTIKVVGNLDPIREQLLEMGGKYMKKRVKGHGWQVDRSTIMSISKSHSDAINKLVELYYQKDLGMLDRIKYTKDVILHLLELTGDGHLIDEFVVEYTIDSLCGNLPMTDCTDTGIIDITNAIFQNTSKDVLDLLYSYFFTIKQRGEFPSKKTYNTTYLTPTQSSIISAVINLYCIYKDYTDASDDRVFKAVFQTFSPDDNINIVEIDTSEFQPDSLEKDILSIVGDNETSFNVLYCARLLKLLEERITNETVFKRVSFQN